MVLRRFDGEAALYTLGYRISATGAGDVDADGVPDIVVGTPRACPESKSHAGSVWVFSGSDSSLLHRFDGQTAGACFGMSADGAGDINADGHDDILVGECWCDRDVGTYGTRPGHVYVFSGGDGSVLLEFDGQQDDNKFGDGVTGNVNLDGDDVPDFLITSSTKGDRPGAGRVYAYSGATESLLYYVEGEGSQAYFGADLAANIGDVNGDGCDDFCAAASGANPRGKTYAGSAYLYSGRDGTLLARFDGEAAGDSVRWVSGAGDVNGNGVPDIIIGARYADPEGRTDAGRVYVCEFKQ
jgi:uncharacterized Zn-binding protein involved in type VI secretion